MLHTHIHVLVADEGGDKSDGSGTKDKPDGGGEKGKPDGDGEKGKPGGDGEKDKDKPDGGDGKGKPKVICSFLCSYSRCYVVHSVTPRYFTRITPIPPHICELNQYTVPPQRHTNVTICFL